MALVLFSGALPQARASMPLTETIATLPEGGAGFSIREEFFTPKDGRRREYAGIDLGALPWLNLGFRFTYLHGDGGYGGQGEIGDAFIRLWMDTGDYLGDRLHTGLLTYFRIPTGRNVYEDRIWRNMAYGNNELKIGPVMQYDAGHEFFHANLFYAFRERDREGFYDRLRLNPLDKEFFTRALGLNPAARGSFLDPALLGNDYLAVACAVNTSRAYPFIPFIELYASRGISPDRETRGLGIEGSRRVSLLAGLGLRYFFSQGVFAGAYAIANPLPGGTRFRETAGVEMAAWF
ncbi:MAG: hypothetical protein EPN93_04280 [Spirochaetes bacterium]|nr:MAG: hypothetical protein EPN93_04280 [Spirochaetota bacterium]